MFCWSVEYLFLSWGDDEYTLTTVRHRRAPFFIPWAKVLILLPTQANFLILNSYPTQAVQNLLS